MTESGSPQKFPFRVFFHDGRTFDTRAVNPLVAEAQACRENAGGFVKKIKRLKDHEYVDRNA